MRGSPANNNTLLYAVRLKLGAQTARARGRSRPTPRGPATARAPIPPRCPNGRARPNPRARARAASAGACRAARSMRGPSRPRDAHQALPRMYLPRLTHARGRMSAHLTCPCLPRAAVITPAAHFVRPGRGRFCRPFAARTPDFAQPTGRACGRAVATYNTHTLPHHTSPKQKRAPLPRKAAPRGGGEGRLGGSRVGPLVCLCFASRASCRKSAAARRPETRPWRLRVLPRWHRPPPPAPGEARCAAFRKSRKAEPHPDACAHPCNAHASGKPTGWRGFESRQAASQVSHVALVNATWQCG